MKNELPSPSLNPSVSMMPPRSHLGEQASDGIGLASIWIGGGAPAGFGLGSSDLDAGVAWIEARGAPGAPQLIPYREGGWALYSRCAVNSQSGD